MDFKFKKKKISWCRPKAIPNLVARGGDRRLLIPAGVWVVPVTDRCTIIRNVYNPTVF